MRFDWLVVYTLGVWRLTHLLSVEDGPWDAMLRLRTILGRGFWGSLLDCFYCLSLWVAIPFALLTGEAWKNKAYLWLAFSAGAILLERATSNAPAMPTYFEHGGQGDAMLREGSTTNSTNDIESKQ
ncbi:MAG TPA: DUF1360 domain-containing protein [Terriglobales bacterium]|jgi:hypothetical protein